MVPRIWTHAQRRLKRVRCPHDGHRAANAARESDAKLLAVRRPLLRVRSVLWSETRSLSTVRLLREGDVCGERNFFKPPLTAWVGWDGSLRGGRRRHAEGMLAGKGLRLRFVQLAMRSPLASSRIPPHTMGWEVRGALSDCITLRRGMLRVARHGRTGRYAHEGRVVCAGHGLEDRHKWLTISNASCPNLRATHEVGHASINVRKCAFSRRGQIGIHDEVLRRGQRFSIRSN